jgi:comEA protein
MKRKIFFWLERLKITPAERRTISGLMVLLLIFAGLNMALSPSVPFEGDHYRELEKQFNKRTAMLQAEEQKLLKQYYPSKKQDAYTAIMDTTEDDSTSDEEAKNADQTVQKKKINVNTADQEALESLPGIGPTYAQRIIAYRKEHGGFETIEELKKIDGIAEKRLENLKPFVKLTDSE